MAVKNMFTKPYYYAKLIGTETVNGRPQTTYQTPILLNHNYQRLSGKSEFASYGEKSMNMYRAVLPNNEYNRELFTRFSLAYFEGNNPEDEFKNGDNANYFVTDVFPVNLSLHVYFERLPKK